MLLIQDFQVPDGKVNLVDIKPGKVELDFLVSSRRQFRKIRLRYVSSLFWAYLPVCTSLFSIP